MEDERECFGASVLRCFGVEADAFPSDVAVDVSRRLDECQLDPVADLEDRR